MNFKTFFSIVFVCLITINASNAMNEKNTSTKNLPKCGKICGEKVAVTRIATPVVTILHIQFSNSKTITIIEKFQETGAIHGHIKYDNEMEFPIPKGSATRMWNAYNNLY